MPGRIAQASDFVLPERQADRQLSRHDEPAKEIRLVGKCDPLQTMRSLIEEIPRPTSMRSGALRSRRGRKHRHVDNCHGAETEGALDPAHGQP